MEWTARMEWMGGGSVICSRQNEEDVGHVWQGELNGMVGLWNCTSDRVGCTIVRFHLIGYEKFVT